MSDWVERNTSRLQVLVIILGMAFVIGMILWLTQPFIHNGKITGFRVEAIASYQEYRDHLSFIYAGKVMVPVHRYGWDTLHQTINALDNRTNPNIDCRYDAEITDSDRQRWLCDVTHYLVVSFDNRAGRCIFDLPQWLYIELNSTVVVEETRMGDVKCKAMQHG